MHRDDRPAFADAKEKMRLFLLDQTWPEKCVWLSEDRVRRKKRRYWLFRPKDASDERAAETLYREILATDSSIKFIGIARWPEESVIVIQKYNGDPGHFYMSLIQGEPDVMVVTNRLSWFIRSMDRGLQQI